jgi:succinoglycan biosynthesis protein ExoA
MQKSTPRVSVVLPCRNEIGYIEPCLESILKQEPPEGGFEILVADGISSDGTREYLDTVAVMHPQVRIINNPGRIVSTGLNEAIRAARGEIIIRMDAHTTFAPDYIKQCVATLEETQADNVGGPARTIAHTYTQRAISAAYHSPFAVGGARFHNVNYEGYLDTVTYGCWRKNLFEQVGYFDEEFVRNQDDEHNLRIVRWGGKIWQSPKIRSWYHVRGSCSALFRQYMQYGYWKVLVIRKHRLPASIRHLVPGAFVAGCFALAVAGAVWLPAFLLLAATLGLYCIVLALASLVTAAKHEFALLPIFPFIFAAYHIGYGYGFVRGIIDFAIFQNAPDTRFVRITRPRKPVPTAIIR